MGLAGDHKPWHRSIFRLTLPPMQEITALGSGGRKAQKPAESGFPSPPREASTQGQTPARSGGTLSARPRPLGLLLRDSPDMPHPVHLIMALVQDSSGQTVGCCRTRAGRVAGTKCRGQPFLGAACTAPLTPQCSATGDPGSRWTPELPTAEAGQLIPDGTPFWEWEDVLPMA